MKKLLFRNEGDEALRRRKLWSALAIAAFILGSLLAVWVIGRPMLRFVMDPQGFRLWVDGRGLLGRLVFVGMMVLQIVVAVIPGEPLEIGAGYAFGFVEGTLLCLIGAVLGSAIVYSFTKRYGVRAVEVFFPRERIQSLRFLQDSRRLNFLTFIIFLIPGTPKDVLTYFIGLTPMKLSTWLLITGTARIPSVVTSTLGGDALGLQNYDVAAIVLLVTLLISGIGLLVYRAIEKREQARHLLEEQLEQEGEAGPSEPI